MQNDFGNKAVLKAVNNPNATIPTNYLLEMGFLNDEDIVVKANLLLNDGVPQSFKNLIAFDRFS